MHTYPSSEDVQGATYMYYYYPGRRIQFQDRTNTVRNIFTHKGAFLAELPIVELQANHIHNISFTSYRVSIYTPGWRAAMWIKCLTEGQMCQALTGIEPATLWSRVKGSLQYTTAPPHIASWEPDEEYPNMGVIKFWTSTFNIEFVLIF